MEEAIIQVWQHNSRANQILPVVFKKEYGSRECQGHPLEFLNLEFDESATI